MPTYQCPICKRMLNVADRADAPYRPFCSRRCKNIDLARWLDGTYRISEPLDPEAYPALPDPDETDPRTTEASDTEPSGIDHSEPHP